ncbi:MAG: ComF family protein [Methylocystaceae bacterium]
MYDLLMDMMFPQQACALCQRPGLFWSRKPWCADCDREISQAGNSKSHCNVCGKYLCSGGEFCVDCRENAPPFFVARAVGPYEGKIKKAIKLLKFVGQRNLARHMGEIMADVVKRDTRYEGIDLIVPVPITNNSLAHRGFNQAELLSTRISHCLKKPSRSDILLRIRETPSQRELTRELREENLKDAFYIKNNRGIENKKILLVDDVYTTGSTTRECTKELLAGGAKEVVVIIWAAGQGY